MAGKGGRRPGAGRPKGSKDKATAQAREAIARFVDGNADRLEEWLEQIAADSPKDAFNCFMSVIEYHVPKLARTELTGDPNKPLHISSLPALTEKEAKALASSLEDEY